MDKPKLYQQRTEHAVQDALESCKAGTESVCDRRRLGGEAGENTSDIYGSVPDKQPCV